MSAISFRDRIKILARSRSWRFTNHIARVIPSPFLGRLRWGGRNILYRRGTTDPFVLYQVLLKRGKKAEYYVPSTLKPKIILDIGSNIGASVIYFHCQFPEAKIFGFEPHPHTFRVLEQNVAQLPGVRVFNYGLGAVRQHIAVPDDKVNYAAFSTLSRFNDRGQPAASVECEVRRLDETLAELGLTQVDLIKIDCEGAEGDIFSTLTDEILYQCQWIVGEFHDQTAFEVLARLAPHFHLDLKKKLSHPRFRFHACNIDKIQQLHRSDLDGLQR